MRAIAPESIINQSILEEFLLYKNQTIDIDFLYLRLNDITDRQTFDKCIERLVKEAKISIRNNIAELIGPLTDRYQTYLVNMIYRRQHYQTYATWLNRQGQ